jgi:hypothetical protein
MKHRQKLGADRKALGFVQFASDFMRVIQIALVSAARRP